MKTRHANRIVDFSTAIRMSIFEEITIDEDTNAYSDGLFIHSSQQEVDR